MHDELENRLDAAFQSGDEASPMPDAVAARVRRCGRVRRAKFAAFGLAPIALAAGLITVQLNSQSAPTSDGPGPDRFVGIPSPGDEYRGLIGWRDYACIFSDVTEPTIAQTSSERVISFRDAYDAAAVEALFSGS